MRSEVEEEGVLRAVRVLARRRDESMLGYFEEIVLRYAGAVCWLVCL